MSLEHQAVFVTWRSLCCVCVRSFLLFRLKWNQSCKALKKTLHPTPRTQITVRCTDRRNVEACDTCESANLAGRGKHLHLSVWITLVMRVGRCCNVSGAHTHNHSLIGCKKKKKRKVYRNIPMVWVHRVRELQVLSLMCRHHIHDNKDCDWKCGLSSLNLSTMFVFIISTKQRIKYGISSLTLNYLFI